MTFAAVRIKRHESVMARHAALAAILVAWFLLALASSLGGVFAATEGPLAVAMPIAIAGPILLFALAYAGFEGMRARVLSIDTRILVLVHTWRTLGLGCLFLYAYDLLPGLFALPAGIGDAVAAVWALVVGVGLYGGFRLSRRQLLAWNSFGAADFVIAVSIGLGLRYEFLDPFTGGVTTSAMTTLPLVLIPAFVVPLLATTHLIIYLQVKHRGEYASAASGSEFSSPE